MICDCSKITSKNISVPTASTGFHTHLLGYRDTQQVKADIRHSEEGLTHRAEGGTLTFGLVRVKLLAGASVAQRGWGVKLVYRLCTPEGGILISMLWWRSCGAMIALIMLEWVRGAPKPKTNRSAQSSRMQPRNHSNMWTGLWSYFNMKIFFFDLMGDTGCWVLSFTHCLNGLIMCHVLSLFSTCRNN